MTEDTDYSKYFNKGNDCDACKHLIFVKEDVQVCTRERDGEECDFKEAE